MHTMRYVTTVTTSGLGRFRRKYSERCEADRCLHHAIAFERVTSWPLHVVAMGNEAIRFYAEDDGECVFDVRGIMSSNAFHKMILTAANERSDWSNVAVENGKLRISYMCWGEEKLKSSGMPLDENKIAECTAAIRANQKYLSLVPVRPEPRFPASALAAYSFSNCIVFAEALSRLTGLPAAIMRPTSLGSGRGAPDDAIHAVVLHRDGEVEDVWGKRNPAQIARRYCMEGWTFDQAAHIREVDDAILKNSLWEVEIVKTLELIRTYRRSTSSP